jgi:hypothetical protein
VAVAGLVVPPLEVLLLLRVVRRPLKRNRLSLSLRR